MKNKFIFYIMGSLLLLATACSDSQLETPLRNGLSEEEALKDAASLESFLNGIYDVSANYYDGDAQVYGELFADNFINVGNADLNQVYDRRTIIFNKTVNDFYTEVYRAVSRANLLMEVVDNASDLSETRKAEMVGEGHFLRGLGLFTIIRLYGKQYDPATANDPYSGIALPINATPDLLTRSTIQEAYDLIIADLKAAEQALPEANGNYATSWAAKALLAKVYFQMNDFINANAYATDVIENGPFTMDANAYATRFSQEKSSENVFSFVSTTTADIQDSRFDSFGKYRTDRAEPEMRLRNAFVLDIMSRPEDKRNAWLTIFNEDADGEFYGLNKFDRDFADVPVAHLTELKLIKAESIASDASLVGGLSTAISNLNEIKSRAGVSLLSSAASASEVITECQRERKIEMVGEGNRKHDLVRRGANGESIIIRNAPWDCPGMLLQFPNTDTHPGVFPNNEEGGCN